MKKWTKLLSICVLAGAVSVGGAMAAGCNKKPVETEGPTQDIPSDTDVAVTSVTIIGGTNLKVGEELNLVAVVLPEDATNRTITWSTSDSSIATVSQNGKVTARAAGEVTITAKSVNNISKTCTITVEAEEPVAHNHSYGEWTVKTTPGKDTKGEATRTCDGEGECDGELTKELPVLSETDYTIEAGSAEGKSKYTLKADKTISFEADSLGGGTVVTPPAGEASIELNKTVLGLIKGKTEKLTATVTVGEGVNKDVTWSTSSEAVATVAADGTVTAVAKGNAIITAKVGDKEATCTVTVIEEVADPDAPQIENVVYELHSAVTGGKLAEKTADSVYGVYAEKNNATEYVQSGASGYTQTINNKDGSNNAQANRSIYISFAKLGGKIEGYFELSASAFGSKWDIVQFNAKDSEGASVKKFCMNVTGNNGVVKYNKGNNNETSAQTAPETALTMAVNTKIKVLYKIVKDGANYKLTISVDGKPFVTNLDIGTDAIEQITLPSSSAGTRLLTIDNVIIGAESIDESVKTVESVTLNKSELELNVGGTETLTATVTPTDAYNATVIWSTSDATVATVDANGKVTAVDGGAAIITAKAGGKEAKCIVTVAITMYTVTFVNDGETVDTVVAQSGSKVTAPVVTKEGYTLSWAIGSVSGAKFDPAQEVVEGNMTLHAVWTEGTTNPPVVNPPVVDPNPGNPPIQNSKISYYDAANESAAFEWADNNFANAKVEYKLTSSSTYTLVDKELIRQIDSTTAHVDILGLKGGATYDFKITTSGNEELTQEGVRVTAYDRSGFAHFNYTDGVGAYNDDGTLKDNALVLYVTDENKNTVSITHKGVTVTGIGNILNSVGQDVGGGKTSNGGTANTNQGIIKKLAEDNIPLVVRFIGCVSDSGLYKKATFNASSTPKIDGLTIYDSTGNGGTEGDNGHMARIKSGKDITLEGVGEDAFIDGWGFHFMAESSSPNFGKSFEVRNLTFINTPEDAIGMEGVQASKNTSSDLSASVERCWIHNNEFYGPDISSPAESDKSEGDGSCDFKRGQYLTVSYNYFEGCHKTNLVGSADYSLQFNLTYHHNYWKLCKARGPLARNANIHMYNNVFEGQTDYAMNTRADAYIFSEYNLFYMCKSPQAVESGAIKSYNDSISSYLTNKGSMGTVVTSKSQIVPNNCKFAARNIDFSKFDTTEELSYIPSGNYILQTDVTEARKAIAALTGVRKRNALSINDIALSDISCIPSGVTPQKITTYPSSVEPGKTKVPYAFTLDRSATVTVSYGSGDGVLVNEAGVCLLDGSGSVNVEPGTYMVQAVNFQPGDAKKLTTGTFKEITVSSISFEEYESEEFNTKLLADYNTKAGLINIDSISYDNASYQLILNAEKAYDILSPELKAQVTVPYTNVTAAFDRYIELGKAEVERLITAIGTVNEHSGSDISKARTAYQALIKLSSDVTISNYSTLVQAEADYEQYAVLEVNNAITALANPSTATTREAIEALLDEYLKVRDMYYDLDEDKRPQVQQNTAKVTDGIAALQTALKPYEVKDMIAELPESTQVTLKDRAAIIALRTEYNALDEAGKTIVGDISKLTEAEAAIAELASKITTVIFAQGTELPDNVTLTGNAKNYDAGNKFTYEGNEYAPLKMETNTEVTVVLSVKTKLIIHLSAGGKKVNINGSGRSSDSNGDLEITLEAGTHKITKNNIINLQYIIFEAAD